MRRAYRNVMLACRWSLATTRASADGGPTYNSATANAAASIVLPFARGMDTNPVRMPGANAPLMIFD